ncbi:hypothetical protein CAEBREN_06001 [Caenorhabditis brenneri]|uniref:Uncharacterized protein n=1 Tax=Caenorhabditis brenneri TaxID=135651 RepID=G0P2K3_CAEBE|nr:hypothetical protein CAEBREN_06001 [Caenorhabditis brenneri]
MNKTDLTNITTLGSVSELLGPVMIYGFCLVFIVFAFCSLILFPFYVNVNGNNRKRDEKTLVFVITNHFCEMVKKTYFIFFFLGIIVTMVVILNDSEEAAPYVFLSFILILITYLTLHVITQNNFPDFILHHQLASNLIFPFIPTHYDKCEEVLLSPDGFEIKTTCLYLLADNDCVGFQIYFAIFSCTKLHIPSLFHTRCDRFPIDDQLLFQICLVVDAFLWFWGNDLFLIIIITITTDIIITPLIIQASYLACNKRNMDALLTSFKPCNLVRMIFNIESSVSVEL